MLIMKLRFTLVLSVVLVKTLLTQSVNEIDLFLSLNIIASMLFSLLIKNAFNINSQALQIKKQKPSVLYLIVGLLMISIDIKYASSDLINNSLIKSDNSNFSFIT